MIKVGTVTFYTLNENNKLLPTIGLKEFQLNYANVIESNGILIFKDSPLHREASCSPYIEFESYIGQRFIIKCNNPKMKYKGKIIDLINKREDILRPVVDVYFHCDNQ